MFEARLELNDDYFLYYVVVEEGERVAAGGLDKTYTLRYEYGPYGELLLRATVNLIMDGPFTTLYAKDEFGVDLTLFGFRKDEAGRYVAQKEDLRLPHFCPDHKG